MSSLADYLAKNYLTADSKKPTKKRKRKAEAAGTVVIADDDATGWDRVKDDEEDDGAPVFVETKSFRRTTKSNWITTGDESKETAAADAIIASNTGAPENPEDAPAVVDDAPQKMSSGAHAGLQTAEQVAAQMKAQRDAEAARFAAADPATSGKGQETIYRDASGRIINIAMARAEARKKIEEEEAKKAREQELQKGDVQRIESQGRRKQLDDAKYMTLGRYADDREMNEELKEKELWNDPAAAFLTSKKKGTSKTGKPLYKGSWAPNRFQIPPGHKWDGVDRGNGFEKKWFQAQNVKKGRQELAYTKQYDLD